MKVKVRVWYVVYVLRDPMIHSRPVPLGYASRFFASTLRWIDYPCERDSPPSSTADLTRFQRALEIN